MSLRQRGTVTRGHRITITEALAKKLDVVDGDFYEAETYSNDKILLTFFRAGTRTPNKKAKKENVT